jgi:hypothetical protein
VVATLVARNANETVVESVFFRSLESGGWFCVGAFGRNLASVTMKMFSHLIHFIKKFYKFCTFNTICKDNAAINYITVSTLPSTLMGHMLGLCPFIPTGK